MSTTLTAVTYTKGDDLPDLTFSWWSSSPTRMLLAFTAQPHTFTLDLALQAAPANIVLHKTVGFVAVDGDPNLTVQWSTTGDLNTLPPGTYLGKVTATRVLDNRQRSLPFRLILRAGIGL